MSPGSYTALHHVNWEAFMGIGIKRTYRWLLVICVALEIAIPWTNASAAEFGFSGMHVQGVNDGVAKALGLSKAEGVLVMDVALGGAADIVLRRVSSLMRSAPKICIYRDVEQST